MLLQHERSGPHSVSDFLFIVGLFVLLLLVVMFVVLLLLPLLLLGWLLTVILPKEYL